MRSYLESGFLKTRIRHACLICLVFLFGFVAGAVTPLFRAKPPLLISDDGISLRGKYRLVSPLLVCNVTETKNVNSYSDLSDKINADITSEKQAGDITDVSVYFQDLNQGQWLNIDSTTQYSPASLLKVPIMIAYLKESESDPHILEKKLKYTGSIDANQSEVFATSSDIRPGTYTVDQLIQAMILYSDNNAAGVLFDNMDKNWLAEVYSDLGLSVQPGGTADAEDITAKQYSLFFKILYDSTYLNAADSEKALELLAGPDFPQGIQSTVPADTVVANKFGERTMVGPYGVVLERELHDCGIVYAKEGPYLLCIMTRGNDFSSLLHVIDSISSIVYNDVDK